MFFSVKFSRKQLSNSINASVSCCFINSSLTIIWNNLGMSYHKCMKRSLEFREKTCNRARGLFKKYLSINVQQNIPPRKWSGCEMP